MAGSSSTQDIFDIRKIRRLVELMKEHELSEIDLQQGETRIQLRRDTQPVVAVSPAPAHYAPAPAAPQAAERPVGEPEPSDDAAHLVEIRSPMVGTFYASSDPDSPPLVKVGDRVGPDTTVCIIEAMKVFNQIAAEVSGKVVAVVVENGAPVEFGQPVFKVDTRG